MSQDQNLDLFQRCINRFTAPLKCKLKSEFHWPDTDQIRHTTNCVLYETLCVCRCVGLCISWATMKRKDNVFALVWLMLETTKISQNNLKNRFKMCCAVLLLLNETMQYFSSTILRALWPCECFGLYFINVYVLNYVCIQTAPSLRMQCAASWLDHHRPRWVSSIFCHSAFYSTMVYKFFACYLHFVIYHTILFGAHNTHINMLCIHNTTQHNWSILCVRPVCIVYCCECA